jgi:HEAT repeat protein
MLKRFAIVSFASTLCLIAQPEKSSWEVLRQGYAEKNPETRRQAITAAGSIGAHSPEAVKFVEGGLKDMDPLVRQTAAGELGEMKSKQSIPALEAALDDSSPEVAFAAAKALWEMGDVRGRKLIEDVLTGHEKASEGFISSNIQDAKRKMHQPKTLAIMGFKEASGALLGPFNIGLVAAEQAFKGGGAGPRVLASTLLVRDCDAETRKLLEKSCTDDKNWAVKASVAKAIGQCGNLDSIPTLERNLSDSHPAVRFMSAASIVRLSAGPTQKQALSLTPAVPASGF